MSKDDVGTANFVSSSLRVKSNGKNMGRRKTIPNRPQGSVSLWTIMKNCIGKELTKIPMPVNFNEPLSVLQRITEDLEYADLLDRASVLTDPYEQMCYVAAYAVSCYSTTANRVTKPFNPILGETYECDRPDLGWWSVAEQVSHHPPCTAHHAEGKNWIMHQDFTATSKFRGKYLSFTPTGYTHIKFKNFNNHYTYKKITTTVHNIVVGKLWIDNHGELQIENHSTGDKGILKFHVYSYFSPDKARKVSGVVKDKKGVVHRIIQGRWDKCIGIAKVAKHTNNSNFEAGYFENIWTINPSFPNSENMYHFTKLAIELNEEEPDVAPTDSRTRPDQRTMERGEFDKANVIKEELEERQRVVRRIRESEAEKAKQKGVVYPGYSPKWFDKTQDEINGNVAYNFNGQYWKCKKTQDWS